MKEFFRKLKKLFKKIINIFKRKFVFAIVYSIIMVLFTGFVTLDAMFIEKGAIIVKNDVMDVDYNEMANVFTDTRYEDDNIKINISFERHYESDFYIVDLVLSDIKYFKTAFAKNMYGRNIIEPTSVTAKRNNAILAFNGDYYGFRDYGYVIRNGVAYRNTARPIDKDACLAIYKDGTVNVYNERQITLERIQELAKEEDKEIYQLFTFGPTLIDNYQKVYNTESEDVIVNPRTCIGICSPTHYKVVVVDGRSETSRGVTLTELSDFMAGYNCPVVYNLDGGGSSTIYFNGKVLNKPSSGIERSVSDIVYIGY